VPEHGPWSGTRNKRPGPKVGTSALASDQGFGGGPGRVEPARAHRARRAQHAGAARRACGTSARRRAWDLPRAEAAPSVPPSLARVVVEIDGWFDLGAFERALLQTRRLRDHPGARPLGLELAARALVELGRYAEALACIEELRDLFHDPDWLDLTEAWCRKRVGDVQGAAGCMERLLARTPRSAIGHFNLGCYLALLGDAERALQEVTLACGMDAGFRRAAAGEADLVALRGVPAFEALLQRGEAASETPDQRDSTAG
jgi:tetratricopeptide (TPR) repeat protein